MSIKELKELINDYPDDQFVHMRIWVIPDYYNFDIVVDKCQQGVSGSLLVTGTVSSRVFKNR